LLSKCLAPEDADQADPVVVPECAVDAAPAVLLPAAPKADLIAAPAAPRVLQIARHHLHQLMAEASSNSTDKREVSFQAN
jgi:hypothetical protein